MNTVFTVGKELGSILLHHWIKRYPDLLVHAYPDTYSGFKTFHPGERIQNGADTPDVCGRTGRLGKKTLRIQKYPDTSGTGPIKSGVIWSFFAYDA